MKKYIYVLSLLFVFTACDEEEIIKKILGEAPEPPAGFYQTECMTGSLEGNTNGSEKYLLELLENGTATLSVHVYATAPDCTGAANASTQLQATLDFKGINLGDDVSFIEVDSTDDQGQPEKSFRPYKYEEGAKVWMVGAEAEETSDPLNPGDVFSDFIGSPREHAEYIFFEVEAFDQI